MGILSRMSTIFKAKMHKMLDAAENPEESLEYSYERQMALLRDVKRNLTGVVASKKRLELQSVKLRENIKKLEEQARDALRLGREDLARLALERQEQAKVQLDGLETQVKELEREQEKLSAVEARLQAKVEAFRTKKEVIKARYSAAEAQVKIGEAATGLSEEMADVSMAIERVEEKTEKMKARAAAIDELVASGTLEDAFSGDRLEAELKQTAAKASIEAELQRLKQEVNSK